MQAEFLIIFGALFVIVILLLIIVIRNKRSEISDLFTQFMQTNERTERELREQIQMSTQDIRQEHANNSSQFQQNLTAQMTNIATIQNNHMSGFAQQLIKLNESMQQQLEQTRQAMNQQAQKDREEQALILKNFGETLHRTLTALTESNARRMMEVRTTLEEKVTQLQIDNTNKLEEMRKTVDEKLHATLEQRLGESFKSVSERLEAVHRGLGEMQQLATGVGDLKRVLTNVKTRGTWGEVQLQMLLEQFFTPEQYSGNVETVPGSGERVEFAIRLPGRDDGGEPMWLPIDAKFPKEPYERLIEASEQADADGVNSAARDLEKTLDGEAKDIAKKYIASPYTTDFAILFLPIEGLYAEVMRRPGLADNLQRKYRVTVAGPSTLLALLNSLQMGFRTLALEKRSSEVWEVLGAVKTEFTRFGEILAKTKTTLERAAQNIEKAEVRTRVMSRKLKSVEALPGESVDALLQLENTETEED